MTKLSFPYLLDLYPSFEFPLALNAIVR